jgi:tryptophan synthase alpha chain
MTERVRKLFENPSGALLSIFYTAGYPEFDATVPICAALEEGGVDFIELGIPFSDPVADGPVIQASSYEAIRNGVTVASVIEQIREIRKSCEIPIFLMGYLNPIYQYGVERFVDDIAEAGADGVIIPDLPLRDYEAYYQKLFEERDLSNVFLVTPQTPEVRVRQLDQLSSGFLYIISSPSITGSNLAQDIQRDEYLQRIASYELTNKRIVGFGISDKESFDAVTQYTDGAIIGSAFIRRLDEYGVNKEKIIEFVRAIRGEVV